MKRKYTALALSLAGALAITTPALAADSGSNTNSKTQPAAAAQSGTPEQAGTASSAGTLRQGSMGATGTTATDARSGNSFSKTGEEAGVSGWANDYAQKHQGRISRKAYMDEMNRRWEAADRGGQGLTPAEVSRFYGNVDSAAGPAMTGSGVQPGNMGPGNAKGK